MMVNLTPTIKDETLLLIIFVLYLTKVIAHITHAATTGEKNVSFIKYFSPTPIFSENRSLPKALGNLSFILLFSVSCFAIYKSNQSNIFIK